MWLFFVQSWWNDSGIFKTTIYSFSTLSTSFCSIYSSSLFNPLSLQATPYSFLFYFYNSIPLSIPSLPLHVSLHPTSVWGAGVDSELASCQAFYTELCSCTVLEKTREASESPLHHLHQQWLDSEVGSLHAHERMAWSGPYAFDTGADVKHRPWALTPCIPSLCPPHRLKPAISSQAMLSGPRVEQV